MSGDVRRREAQESMRDFMLHTFPILLYISFVCDFYILALCHAIYILRPTDGGVATPKVGGDAGWPTVQTEHDARGIQVHLV